MMKGFDKLPMVSEGVYDKVRSEYGGMNDWNEALIANTIAGGWGLLGQENPLLVKAANDVLQEVKGIKERASLMVELYFLLRLINDALLERG